MRLTWTSPRLALTCALFLAAAAHAQVRVEDAWVRATVARQKATGAFMRLTAARDTRLVAVSSPAAGVAQVHEMQMSGDVMKMHAIDALPLPAGKTVELKPGGYHIMLMDLKQPVSAGGSVPLTLVFEGQNGQRESLDVQASVRALNVQSVAAHGQPRHDSHAH
jgi:copper(I)-binding protein